ncbi:hypothetical protein [Nostoc sp. UHCC 0870]|uniref:hypothetical protein n=1 Tax=Nostoc sp. UHCC 0870 TaxID=2914041 RepID=UPI001EDE2734|nr:hypothetical protein [Nostoc sp. UHCC 0870]UKP01143.1 hypothetical protein L6494_28745 [Nostoc sp. UHCC 0870]
MCSQFASKSNFGTGINTNTTGINPIANIRRTSDHLGWFNDLGDRKKAGRNPIAYI